MKYQYSALALGLVGTAAANWSDWSSDPVKKTTSSSATSSATTSWEDWATASSSTPAVSTKSSSSYDPWLDWSSSVPADSSKTSSKTSSSKDPWADWASSSAPAASTTPAKETVTVTETKYDATTTIYKSTVFVGPGDCTKTVFPTTCGGSAPTGPAPSKPADASKPASSPAAASSAPADGGWGAPSSSSPAAASSKPADGGWGAKSSGSPAAASSKPADGGWTPSSSPDAGTSTGKITAVVSSTGAAPSGGWGGEASGPLNPGISSASIVGTNEQVYTWTGDHDPKPTVSAAPTYAGWGDWHGGSGSGSGSGINGTGSGINGTGPAPGTDASNVTEPFKPLAETGCNSASDRSKWCGKYSIDTDSDKEGPDTGKVCSAKWVITNTTLNYDGVNRLALAINGQVPGPLLECNWGDTISVTVTNQLSDNATTIHWHGINQRGSNDQDGVPGVTECAIAPGSTRTYTFKASQYGTAWYHSHAYSQLGDGIRGPMVIHGPATSNYDVDAGTVMIDDLFGTGSAPMTVAETNARIAHFGPGGTWNYMLNGANTFPDLSKGKHALWKVKSGKKYLFRLINSASQNMFSVHFDNHKMTVISTDLVPITPYQTEWLNIGIGQRYSVIVEMNQPTAGYFLRAVTQTGCPSGCANNGLGKANGIFAYEGADLTLPTSTAGNKTAADFAICADEPLASLKPYLKKSGGSQQAFTNSVKTIPAGAVANVSTPDDGVVFRWFINNGAMNVNFTQPTLRSIASGTNSNSTVSNYITLTSKNQWVYFVIQNQFFAAHPMHLHGHDMSVLGQGTVAWNPSLVSTLNFDNPTRRDTAMLAGSRGPGAPPGYTVIGFETDNPGAWLMHCHIIWHVDGGLALQWIERPDEIKNYYGSAAFKDECAANAKYEASAPGRVHTSGESGLKARDYSDSMMQSENVRRHLKRGLGDGYKPRHGLRR